MKDCPHFIAANNKKNGAKALFLHTSIITKFQPHCLLTKQPIYNVSVSRYCLGKILQWLLIASRYQMQKLCLNTPQNNPQEIWSALIRCILWRGHLRCTEAQRQSLIEHRGGSPFVIIFRGGQCRPTLGAGSVEALSSNANEICCFLPACWISWVSRHMMQQGNKKKTTCHKLTACFIDPVIVLSPLPKLICTHHCSTFLFSFVPGACFYGKQIESVFSHQFEYMKSCQFDLCTNPYVNMHYKEVSLWQ